MIRASSQPCLLSRRRFAGLAVLALPGAVHSVMPVALAAPASIPLSGSQATRITAIGGAVTETVYALEMADRIVAVDSTSLFPPDALKEKKNVGYMRALSAEGVLSVDPTAILMIDNAGPPAVVEQLQSSAVPVVMVDGACTPQAVSARARFLGRVLDVPARGAALAARIEAGFQRLAAERATHALRTRVMFVLSLRGGRVLAAGRDTAADSLITLTGATNALDGFTGYKPLTDEAVIQSAPDVVLIMKSGDGQSDQDAVLELAAFRATPAGRRKAVVAMDGETLLAFGPRTPETALSLMQRFATLTR